MPLPPWLIWVDAGDALVPGGVDAVADEVQTLLLVNTDNAWVADASPC